MPNSNPQSTYNQYKVRKFTSNNRSGDAYGITLPRNIGKKFEGIKFSITLLNDSIVIFKSGLDLMQLKKDAQYLQLQDL